MWDKGWRNLAWSVLDQPWDIIIIGGGITGAGILREAVRAGLRVLLVEGHDFASGTSSRSSKLVHGGFRYLKNVQIRFTLESVRERERLLKEGRGLVSPLGFLLTTFRHDPIPGWVFRTGLIIYDLLALKWGHRHYDAIDMHELCPNLNEDGLLGGFRYFDAQTDDARLVLRLILEACGDGATALNYALVTGLLRNQKGMVTGIVLQDQTPEGNGRIAEIQAKLVINATGAWVDNLRNQVGGRPRIRKLRGSHLIFPFQRLPLTRAVSFLHPSDGRPVFAFPWEGVTIVGTTDIDHTQALQTDPAISLVEVEYLLEAANKAFPVQELKPSDIQSTYSGLRPVINTGKSDPSKESREHILWCESGLLTVAGGKLTTFRLMARDALKAACARQPQWGDRVSRVIADERVLDAPPDDSTLSPDLKRPARLRLVGRYGASAAAVLAASLPGEMELIPGTPYLWAELRWGARAEAVEHLDDLLLRRVRLGLLLPEGGLALAERIRAIAQSELSWDEARWKSEFLNYTRLWKASYTFER